MSEFVPRENLTRRALQQRKALHTEDVNRRMGNQKRLTENSERIAATTPVGDLGTVSLRVVSIYRKIDGGLHQARQRLEKAERALQTDDRVERHEREVRDTQKVVDQLKGTPLTSLYDANQRALGELETLPDRDPLLAQGIAHRRASGTQARVRAENRKVLSSWQEWERPEDAEQIATKTDSIQRVSGASAGVDALEEAPYILPDGTAVKGNFGRLLHLLPKIAGDITSEDTHAMGRDQILEALYSGVPLDAAIARLSMMIARGRKLLAGTDIEIVNLTPLGNKQTAEYYLKVAPDGFALSDEKLVTGVEGVFLAKLSPFQTDHVVTQSELLVTMVDQAGDPQTNFSNHLSTVSRLLKDEGLQLSKLQNPADGENPGFYVEPLKEVTSEGRLLGEVLRIGDRDIRLSEQQRRLLSQLGTQPVLQTQLDDYLLRSPNGPEVHFGEEMNGLRSIVGETAGEDSIVQVGNEAFGIFYKLCGVEIDVKYSANYLPLHPVQLDAATLYLDGRTPEEILAVLEEIGIDDARSGANNLLVAFQRLRKRSEENILTAEEESIHARLPQDQEDLEVFLRTIRKQLKFGEADEEQKPELIALPDGIVLSEREEQFFAKLQGSSTRRVVTKEDLLGFVPNSASDKLRTVQETVRSMNRKLRAAELEVTLVDDLSDQERKGYILRRVVHIEPLPAVEKEAVALPEFPAEFGALSKADVGMMAGAIKAQRNFLGEVLKQVGTSLVEESILDSLSDNYAETPAGFEELDEGKQASMVKALRQRAFDTTITLLAADNFAGVLEEIASQDPQVALLIKNLAEIQKTKIELARSKEIPVWVNGVDAVKAITTEPELLKSGVRVKDASGIIVAKITLETTGGELRHQRRDKVVVAPVTSPLGHLQALMEKEKPDEAKDRGSELTYTVPGLEDNEGVVFKGRAAQLLDSLSRTSEREVLNSGVLQATLGLVSRSGLRHLIAAVEADLAGTGYSIISKRGPDGGYWLSKPTSQVVEQQVIPKEPPSVAGDLQPGVAVDLGSSRNPREKEQPRVLVTELRGEIEESLNQIEKMRLQGGAKAGKLKELFGSQMAEFNFDTAKVQELISGKLGEDTRYTPEDIAVILCLVRYGSKLNNSQRSDVPRLLKQIQEERKQS